MATFVSVAGSSSVLFGSNPRLVLPTMYSGFKTSDLMGKVMRVVLVRYGVEEHRGGGTDISIWLYGQPRNSRREMIPHVGGKRNSLQPGGFGLDRTDIALFLENGYPQYLLWFFLMQFLNAFGLVARTS